MQMKNRLFTVVSSLHNYKGGLPINVWSQKKKLLKKIKHWYKTSKSQLIN